jgi:hypothetical protein
MEVYRKIDYKGYEINIAYDSDALNPREEWDNFFTIASFDFKHWLAEDKDYLETFLEENKKPYRSQERLFMPIYFKYNGSQGWMVSLVSKEKDPDGWIYAYKSDIRKEWKVKTISPKLLKNLKNGIEAEIDVFNHYLQGEVYGYTIKGPVDKYGEREDLDSTWGYYGDPEKSGLIQEAEGMINWYIEKEIEKAKNDQKSWSYMAL